MSLNKELSNVYVSPVQTFNYYHAVWFGAALSRLRDLTSLSASHQDVLRTCETVHSKCCLHTVPMNSQQFCGLHSDIPVNKATKTREHFSRPCSPGNGCQGLFWGREIPFSSGNPKKPFMFLFLGIFYVFLTVGGSAQPSHFEKAQHIRRILSSDFTWECVKKSPFTPQSPHRAKKAFHPSLVWWTSEGTGVTYRGMFLK